MRLGEEELEERFFDKFGLAAEGAGAHFPCFSIDAKQCKVFVGDGVRQHGEGGVGRIGKFRVDDRETGGQRFGRRRCGADAEPQFRAAAPPQGGE